MPRLKNIVIDKSRNRDFLVRAVLLIGLVGIIGGYLADKFGPGMSPALRSAWMRDNWRELPPELEELLKFSELSEQLADGSLLSFDAEDAAEWIRNSPSGVGVVIAPILQLADPLHSEMLAHYAAALHSEAGAYGESRDALAKLAARRPQVWLANELYADVLRRAQEHDVAGEYFRAEIVAYPDSRYAREGEIDALLQGGDVESVARLFDDPDYRAHLQPATEFRVLVELERWVEFSLWEGKSVIANQTLSMLLLTGFSGLLWFTIVALLGRGWMARRGWVLYLLGVLSGFLSTFVVIALSVWQQKKFGFYFNGDFANDLIYCISGIGLREELVKLLFFAPFLPVLLRARSSMRALATAGCVGLGFAISENLTYFGPGLEGGIFLRFITANFLHISLTGLLGLALFHFIRWPKSRWEEFLATFLLVVLAHGVYDALAGLVPQLARQFGIFWIVIFAVLTIRYFSTAREVREGGASPLSPLGVFVVGGALLVAGAWIHACWNLPPKMVMQSVGRPVLELGILAFLFINQFRGE